MPADNEDRKAYWRPHVDQWQSSGLSAKRFCQDHALPYSQFLYWANKLRPENTRPRQGGFVRVVPSQDNAAAQGLFLALPNGVRIGGIDAGNVSLIPQLLEQL
jgi:hypothetical protein